MAAAASFNGYFDKWHFREAGTSAYMAGASFDAIVDGTAVRPYIYRQLLPAVANWIDARVAEGAKDRLYEVIEIEDRWYGPDRSYFKVFASEAKRYLLRHNLTDDAWTITAI